LKKIIFAIVLTFVTSFQVYGANPVPKPIDSKITNHSNIAKPPGTMKPMIKMPDLMIQKFVLSPNMVKNGDECSYELVIKNNGGQSSLNQMLVGFNITPQLGRSDYLPVPGPGQSQTFTGVLGVPVNKCMALTYTVELDAHHKIKESNENNNKASYSIGIEGRPAIGFCTTATGAACQALFINGGVNDDIYIGSEVHNFGCAISPAGSIDLNFPEQWPQTIQIPPIQPGKFFAFYTYMQWDKPGVKNGQIILRYNQGNVKIYNDRVQHKVNIVAQ
jgi:hypothetical protein